LGVNTLEKGRNFGVFGRCDSPAGAGINGFSESGIGVAGVSTTNDGVVGTSGGEGRSGVLGVNTLEKGRNFGVFGRCDSPAGAGINGFSESGIGVAGVSTTGAGISGLSESVWWAVLWRTRAVTPQPC
jgi:hypothetical protein